MGKIQDQSVSTYILDSLSVCTLALPVATDKAVISDGNALCSPALVGLDKCGSLQIVSKSWPKMLLTKTGFLSKILT